MPGVASAAALLGSHSLRDAMLSNMKTDQATPHCPDCGKPMLPARSVPRLGGLPELRTFKCENCGAVVTEEVQVEFLELANL